MLKQTGRTAVVAVKRPCFPVITLSDSDEEKVDVEAVDIRNNVHASPVRSEDDDEPSETKSPVPAKTPAVPKKRRARKMRLTHAKRRKPVDVSNEIESTDEEQFEVDYIIGHRAVGKELLFKVRWEGYTEQDDTEEPLSSLLTTLDLQNYWRGVMVHGKPDAVTLAKGSLIEPSLCCDTLRFITVGSQTGEYMRLLKNVGEKYGWDWMWGEMGHRNKDWSQDFFSNYRAQINGKRMAAFFYPRLEVLPTTDENCLYLPPSLSHVALSMEEAETPPEKGGFDLNLWPQYQEDNKTITTFDYQKEQDDAYNSNKNEKEGVVQFDVDMDLRPEERKDAARQKLVDDGVVRMEEDGLALMMPPQLVRTRHVDFVDLCMERNTNNQWIICTGETPLTKGTPLMPIIGRIVDKEEANTSMKTEGELVALMNFVRFPSDCNEMKDKVIDRRLKTDFSRFVSHSCTPNCEVRLEKDHKGRPQMTIFNKWHFRENTTLTIDWFTMFEEDVKKRSQEFGATNGFELHAILKRKKIDHVWCNCDDPTIEECRKVLWIDSVSGDKKLKKMKQMAPYYGMELWRGTT